MQKLLAFEFTSDTASFELFDKLPEAQAAYRPRPSGRGEVRPGNVARARRHVAAPLDHARRLDTFFKVREEVQDIARSREAAGRVASTQIGAVKGKGKMCKRSRRAHVS